MQVTNLTYNQNQANMNFGALRVSDKAIEEVEFMGRLVKQEYEKIWKNIAQHIEDSEFYDVFINGKLRPVFVEKATGTELRNVRLRSKSLDTIGLSADICEKELRRTDSHFTIPNPEHFFIITRENKLIEDCNDIVKVTKALEAYKKTLAG